MEPATSGAGQPPAEGAYGHLDTEDKRVKELTEGILYDFLPAALNVMLPRCEEELDADRCRAVASAALAVSALMNAPPGFLEFLLCVPWRKLSQLYPKSDTIDKLVSNLQVTDEERRKLVNTRIEPALMGSVLDFLYKDKHLDSVPPLLQLTPVNPLQPALARVVYVHICLLLETEAQASPTRSLVWRAEQCLREWDRLEKAGLTQGAGVLDPRHVVSLQLWAKTADSDLYLAEALHGQALPPTKSLQEVVVGAVTYSPGGLPILGRPVSAEVVAALEQAITLSSLPSPLLAHIVRSVVANATAELGAAARLRELVGAKGAALGGGGTSEAAAALSEALRAAEPFRARLGPELEAAQELRGKWMQRASAVEKLEAAVDEGRPLGLGGGGGGMGMGGPGMVTGRQSLQLAPGVGSQQGGGGGGGGGVVRSSFWAPPAFQASAELGAEGGGGGGSVQQAVDWAAAAQGDLGAIQMLHLSQQAVAGLAGGGGGGMLRGGSGGAGGAGGGGSSASRVCRFHLQGYCRDGERCRFAHAGGGAGGGGGGPAAAAVQLLQLPSPQHAHMQGGGGSATAGVGQSSAVGSFAFGAPGAEAFAPMGGLGRGGGGAGGGGGEALEALGGSAPRSPRMRPGSATALQAGSMGGLPAAIALLERSHQLAGAAQQAQQQAQAQGHHLSLHYHHYNPHLQQQLQQQQQQQQAVQLRDSATGATYTAVLTVSPPSPGGGGMLAPALPSPTAHQQQQQLVLPDDLTFSPPSNPSTPGVAVGMHAQPRK
ncbi:hypothetical protein TSOC_013761 [Tetrabaena socialis]|uniref:C3H1-type domain-containing protein n=1 Tax=Tetrabaena socialis TaxID=47790 RepID=A0A2J7ZJH9_9CHLO|nr:hypothetical protein TSOC_013761 [Tetrabaena socialis]|eukprot:PNH00417.1 hypothetical protein TSOC_013761 [Tetrabaena socialis]